MSAESERANPSPSPSASPRYRIVNDSSPGWLPGGPWGLRDNHEDSKKDIWTTPLEGKHWGECRDMLKKHDKRVLDDLKDEIKTQLLVSSLLAAVAGGFVIESQKSLFEDPAVTSAVILLQIARQLNESIGVPATDLVTFGGPSRVERAFNALFYASLGLSVANVILGLLCLQWIRGMRNEPPGVVDSGYLSFHSYRYLGFEQGGAKDIISSLPLLLLAALLAFFGGLLVLASDSDWISSIPLYLILPSVVAIVLYTTFSPGVTIVLNSAFCKGSNFPSMPPFRSLQSWIVMQGFIWIIQATNGFFEWNPFGALPQIRKCLDWGQIDLLWFGWSCRVMEHAYSFPLILSTGTLKELNMISNIIEDAAHIKAGPMSRKLSILVATFTICGKTMPATTHGKMVDLFLGELIGMINVGASLESISFAFTIEEMISLDFASEESLRQLINSLSFLCRTQTPFNKDIWNLFWKALADFVQTTFITSSAQRGPILFNDAFDSMKVALENTKTDTQMVFQRGFKSFVKALAYEVEQERGWAQPTMHSVTLSLIVSHPIWVPARRIITTLPPGEHTKVAQECLRTLDCIRQKIPPRTTPIPPAEPSASPDGSVGMEVPSEREDGLSTTSSHIAIDFEPKHDHDDVASAVVDAPVIPGVTELEKDEVADEFAGGTEEEMAFDQERPITTTVSPFALPTALIVSAPISAPGPPPLWSTTSSHTAVDIEPDDDDDVTSAFVAAADLAGVTELEEDEHTAGTEEEISSNQEQPATAMASSFTLPTPPIDSPTSPTSPPSPPPL